MSSMKRLLGRATFSAHLAPLIPYGGYIISLFCMGMLANHYVLDASFSAGPSMVPTIGSHGHYAFYSRWHRRGKGIKVGDIIQADHPMFVGQPIAKRVIGVAGDYVVLDGDMEASVGGAPVPGIVEYDKAGGRRRVEPRMVQVPEGHVWVAGDNLAWSRDSRFYGPLPMALIKGKLLLDYEGIMNWRYFGNDVLGAFDESKMSE